MIRDAHTNIVKIEKDGIVIFETEDKMYRDESRKKQARPVIHGYSLAEILRYVNTVPVEEIAFIEKAYTMNLELLKEGLASDRACSQRNFIVRMATGSYPGMHLRRHNYCVTVR